MGQADHAVPDAVLLDDRGAPVRPWLTIVLDDPGRTVAGNRLTTDAPSAMSTALPLRQAIRAARTTPPGRPDGIPERLDVDNGSDFVAEHVEPACIALRIRLVQSRPGPPSRARARARAGIERLFRTIDDMLRPDVPGHLIGDRPLSPPSIDLAEPTARFERFLHDVHHRRVHGTTGEAPIARGQAGGSRPALPESREALDMLLLRVPGPRRVGRDGIRFMGRRDVEPTLAAFVGEPVEAPPLAMRRRARRRATEGLEQSVIADEVRREHHDRPSDRPRPDPRFGGLRLHAAADRTPTIERRRETPLVETRKPSRVSGFARACATDRPIGVCLGRPGIGRTRLGHGSMPPARTCSATLRSDRSRRRPPGPPRPAPACPSPPRSPTRPGSRATGCT